MRFKALRFIDDWLLKGIADEAGLELLIQLLVLLCNFIIGCSLNKFPWNGCCMLLITNGEVFRVPGVRLGTCNMFKLVMLVFEND